MRELNPGRNDPCPCGSERRYKSCCGRLAEPPLALQTDTSAEPRAAELARLSGLMDGAHYAELEAATGTLLEQHPRSALLWQLLGLAHTRQNKDPRHALAMAVQCAPQDAVAHLNLANALGRCGQLAEAAASYRRALEADPEFAEAHNNLGELCLELGRTGEALASCQEALRIRPDFAEAHQNAGKALVRLGRFDEAARSCRHALAINPEYAEAYNTLGSAQLALAAPSDAIESFGRAVAIKPAFAEAHANLARALRGSGRLADAVAGFRRALELKPDLVLAHTELATALRLQRRSEEAEQSCRRALLLDPQCAAAVVVLAELRADAGQFAEAEELFCRALRLDPASPEAWAGLARVRRMTPADREWLAAMQRLVEQGMPPQRELLLRYAIGKHLDDLGDFSGAFDNYRSANQLAKSCGLVHVPGALSRTVDLIIRAYDGQWVGRQRPALPRAARPVFIIGMLRSGTSLAEQILASHPQIYGAGELTFWSETAAAALTEVGGADVRALRMSEAALADCADRYLKMLRELAPDALRVVDKLPTNFLHLGLIATGLPGARIIHLVRHPIDTCLSIYFQHFEAANTYANDLTDLAHYYREYRRLMQHWRTVLPPGTILEVPYEGLVGDLPAWTRRMLDFVGVSWDERCLDFDRTVRPVVTASKWQVRQKLYGSSVGRWRRYESFVGPLMPLAELHE